MDMDMDNESMFGSKEISLVEPWDAPTEGDPDDMSGGGEEVLAVVGVHGGGLWPGGIPEGVVLVGMWMGGFTVSLNNYLFPSWNLLTSHILAWTILTDDEE